MKNASTMNSVKLFPALAALLLAVLAAAAQSNDPAVAARPAVAAAPAAPDLELSERVRAESIALTVQIREASADLTELTVLIQQAFQQRAAKYHSVVTVPTFETTTDAVASPLTTPTSAPLTSMPPV